MLSLAYSQVDDLEKAKEYMEKASKLDPGDKSIKQILDVINAELKKEKPLDNKKKKEIMKIFCPYCGELLAKNKSTCPRCEASIKV